MGVDLFGRKLPLPTEKMLQTQICLWLRVNRHNFLCWEQPQAGYFDAKKKIFRKHFNVLPANGTGDILGIYRGFHFELEVKKPGAKQSDVQKHHEKEVRKHGGHYFVVHSLEEAQNAVTSIMRQVNDLLDLGPND